MTTLVEQAVERQLSTGYRYQQFGINENGLVPGEKCRQKLRGYREHLPDDLTDKRVLDVGSNLGFFTFLAAQRGAIWALGIEKEASRRNWCLEFRHAVEEELPRHRDWVRRVDFGSKLPAADTRWDVILLCSVYHHLYKTRMDHALWMGRFAQYLPVGGYVLYEGPMEQEDYVIDGLFPNGEWKPRELLRQMKRQFSHVERVGSAIHAPFREVWVLWR